MSIWWQAIRPKTLLASIGPVLLATALAKYDGFFDTALFIITLVCALFLQISVNLANDLYDGISGVDSSKRLGPKRVLQSGLVSVSALSLAVKVSVCISIVSGIYLVYQGGFLFLLLGSACLLGIYAYSAGPFPLASNALGELSVFVFFGLVAVLGSYFLQTGSLSLNALILAVTAGIQSSAIMLVNNIRDIETDAKAGKITLAVRLGDARSRQVFSFLMVGSLLVHLIALTLVSTLDAFVIFIPALICSVFLPILYRAITTYSGTKLNVLLAKTALFGFIYAVVVSISLLASSYFSLT